MQLKNNCTSNSQVIARGEAKCNFDCYQYNYSLIARKYTGRQARQFIYGSFRPGSSFTVHLQLRFTYSTNPIAPVLSCIVKAHHLVDQNDIHPF